MLSNGGVLTWTSLNAYNRLNKYIARFLKISNDKYKDIFRDIDKIRQKAYIQQRLFDEYDLYEQTGEDDGFDIPSEEVIREMVDNPIDKMKLPKVLQKHRDVLVSDIQASIISGTVKGSGFEKVAQDIKQKTGFSSEKARLVARTEIGRARSTEEVEMDEKIKKTGVEFNKY